MGLALASAIIDCENLPSQILRLMSGADVPPWLMTSSLPGAKPTTLYAGRGE
jgi:hypothetical protein